MTVCLLVGLGNVHPNGYTCQASGSKCKYEGYEHQLEPYIPDAECWFVSNKRHVIAAENLTPRTSPTFHTTTDTYDSNTTMEHMVSAYLRTHTRLATPTESCLITHMHGSTSIEHLVTKAPCVLHTEDAFVFGNALKYVPTAMASHHSPEEVAARKEIADQLTPDAAAEPGLLYKHVATAVCAGSFDLQLTNPDVDLYAMVTQAHQHVFLTGVASSNSYGNTLISSVQLRFINKKALKEHELRDLLEPLLGGSLAMSVTSHAEHIAKIKWDTWKVTIRSSDPTTTAPLLRFLLHLYDPNSPLHHLPIIHQKQPEAPAELIAEATPLVRVISSEHHSATASSHQLQAKVFLVWDKYAGAQLSSRVYKFLRMAVRSLAASHVAAEAHSNPIIRALEVEHVFQQDAHRKSNSVVLVLHSATAVQALHDAHQICITLPSVGRLTLQFKEAQVQGLEYSLCMLIPQSTYITIPENAYALLSEIVVSGYEAHATSIGMKPEEEPTFAPSLRLHGNSVVTAQRLCGADGIPTISEEDVVRCMYTLQGQPLVDLVGIPGAVEQLFANSPVGVPILLNFGDEHTMVFVLMGIVTHGAAVTTGQLLVSMSEHNRGGKSAWLHHGGGAHTSSAQRAALQRMLHNILALEGHPAFVNAQNVGSMSDDTVKALASHYVKRVTTPPVAPPPPTHVPSPAKPEKNIIENLIAADTSDTNISAILAALHHQQPLPPPPSLPSWCRQLSLTVLSLLGLVQCQAGTMPVCRCQVHPMVDGNRPYNMRVVAELVADGAGELVVSQLITR